MKRHIAPTLMMIAIALLYGCAQSDEEAGLKNRVVEANQVLINEGDLSRVGEYFADKYANQGVGEGPEAIRSFVSDLREAFPDIQVTVEQLVGEGDIVAWRRLHTGTHQEEIAGIPASGERITWESLAMSRFENGKIVEEWGISDLSTKLRAETREAAAFSETDAAAVRQNLERFAASSPVKTPDTFFAQFTDDVHWAPGPNFYATNLQELREGDWCTEIQHERIAGHVEGVGGLAYIRGSYSLSLDCGGEEPENRDGRFLSVHRKQPDGTWQIASMIGDQG